jgi:hypothetical protein
VRATGSETVQLRPDQGSPCRLRPRSAVSAFSGVAPPLAPQRLVGSPRTTAVFEPLALVAITE